MKAFIHVEKCVSMNDSLKTRRSFLPFYTLNLVVSEISLRRSALSSMGMRLHVCCALLYSGFFTLDRFLLSEV